MNDLYYIIRLYKIFIHETLKIRKSRKLYQVSRIINIANNLNYDYNQHSPQVGAYWRGFNHVQKDLFCNSDNQLIYV